MRLFLITIISLLLNSNIFAQGCCSGGAGSPIAGGAATGVLQENQLEISLNHQYNKSNKFFVENRDTTGYFDNFNSNYLFLRADYGLSKKLTMSIATGYFLNKSQMIVNLWFTTGIWLIRVFGTAQILNYLKLVSKYPSTQLAKGDL